MAGFRAAEAASGTCEAAWAFGPQEPHMAGPLGAVFGRRGRAEFSTSNHTSIEARSERAREAWRRGAHGVPGHHWQQEGGRLHEGTRVWGLTLPL